MMATGEMRTSLAHHDGAGAFVDDDAGRAIGFHRELLQIGHELDGARGVIRRDRHATRAEFSAWPSARRPREFAVDDLGDTGGGGEIGLVQLQPYVADSGHGRRRPLDDGARGDAAHGGMIHGLVVGGAAGDEARR